MRYRKSGRITKAYTRPTTTSGVLGAESSSGRINPKLRASRATEKRSFRYSFI
jgi:hypothetical protein